LNINNLNYSKTIGDLTLSTNFSVLGNISSQSSVYFSQIYLGLDFRAIEFKAGKFFREQGLNSSDIGIGSMVLSRNTRSIPGIEIGTRSYQKVPFAQGYVKYKLNYGNFWFDEDRYIDAPKLHSKSFYLQFDISPIKFNAGLIHNVIWGGSNPENISLGNSFGDFVRINLGAPAAKGFMFEGEITNTLGNTVAAYDGGIEWEEDKFKINLTRLFYMEDKSNAMLRSFWDGQWSVDLKLKESSILERLRFDHMYTIRQDAVDEQPGGRANYYSHYLYQNGWTYRGNVLGTPFIEFDFNKNVPSNNMMIVSSLAANFKIWEGSNFTSIATYKRSYGVCENLTTTPTYACKKGGVPDGETLVLIPRNELRNDRYHFLLGLNQKLNSWKGTWFNIFLGYDIYEENKYNFGISLGITYKPNFR